MKVLLEIAGDEKEVTAPAQLVRAKTGLCDVTVKKYLRQLEEEGYIKIYFGSRFSINRICFLKKEILRQNGGDEQKKVPTPHSALPIGQTDAPKLKEALDANDQQIVALVDYDNVVGTISSENFGISFAKLKQRIREYGKIIFADAFLSMSSNRPDIISRLNSVGWRTITCPMEAKEKDSVDSKIKMSAISYLRLSAIAKVVIVSRDSDFHDLRDLAENELKELIFVNVKKERLRIEGEDKHSELPTTSWGEKFNRAIQCLRVGWKEELRTEEKEWLQFVKEMIRELNLVLNNPRIQNPRFGFRHLEEVILRKMKYKWGNNYGPHVFKAALSALVDAKVLCSDTHSTQFGHRTHYLLAKSDPAFVNTFSNPYPARQMTRSS